MQMRKLGRNGPEVSAIGLGCMGMSWAYGTASDEATSFATLHRALELGINFFDTAEVYGPYLNEELLGRAFRDRRDQVVLATKFGFRILPETEASGLSRIAGLNSRPENVKAVAEASLKRFGTDHIDLFYQHRVDPAVPIEETVGAMSELVREGKVLHLGLSEAPAEMIRRAHAVHPIAAVQSEYSLWTRDPEPEVLPTLRELGIALVPFSPLGRGFLTGAVTDRSGFGSDDFRSNLPRFSDDNLKKNLSLVETLKQLADARGATSGQLALAWLLHQGEDIIPIPGTKRIAYLEENAAAADIRLTQDEVAAIDRAVPETAVAGARYAETQQIFVQR
ncbi:Predicted oxidoreductase [Faunimonas pinastri]|uniref:Predicted oxidoreductase n=1 Tax=Faunimonas pinastri TaxID=1855383 RepID=A0A1H9NLF1_9HYPH|nr:aldo/keto reductase [Faunimonas pinastri]SER36844.1 Predicted oxidoreductase [Faunimonas pinastri]